MGTGGRSKWVWTRERRPLGGAARGLLILALAIVGGTAIVWAQAPTLPASAMVAAGAETDVASVRLLVGRSTVVDVGANIARVSLTSADIADALVTSPSQLLINGKMPGTISMFVWDRAGAIRRYEVIVQRDLARLMEQVRQLFPNENIDVQSNGKNVVLSGTVSNKDVIEKAVNVASGYVDKREEVVTLLQLREGAPSNQVLLKVRFAEVSRSGLSELGASFAANGADGGRWFGRTTSGQFPAPEWDEDGRFVFSDFLNLFLFDTENQLAAVIKAMTNRGLFQSLAEPNLVAESGKEASFLAGGEFPIPVAQGSGGAVTVSVMFKEFGIRLNFTPTVLGERVHLKVRPEVSTLDFNNAVVLQGFRIPALSTRRTETELELQNGQTFAIAGLINNNLRSSMQRIPGIGNIPVLGLLFSSRAAQKEQTELVVMITPHILPNNSPGVTPNLPRLSEPFQPAPPMRNTTEPPPPAFGRGPAAGPSAAAAPGPQRANGTAPNPTSAAAAVTALTPSAPKPVEPARGRTTRETTPATTVTNEPAAAAPAASPTAAATPAAAAAAPAGDAPTRPLTSQEKKAIEQARRDEQRKAEEYAKAMERAKKAEAERLAKEREQQEKAGREQAKKDRENARRAEEAARRQAEIDRERQKAINEAAARLKAAEAAYQSEIAKRNQQQQ